MSVEQRLKAAYEQGKDAAEKGYERTSPYINLNAEHYWYAGFDGIPYEQVRIENE